MSDDEMNDDDEDDLDDDGNTKTKVEKPAVKIKREKDKLNDKVANGEIQS